MTTSKEIMNAILNNKLVEAKEKTEELLFNKMAHHIQDRYEDVAPPVFEGKKLDPVDKDELKGKHKDREDTDIDNDGDSDDSDKFLHKKRKAISKAVDKKKIKEGDELDIAKEKETIAKSQERIKKLSDKVSKEKKRENLRGK